MVNSDFSQEEKGKKESKIELPFEQKQGDWGSWIYDHRVGVFVTVIAYLLLAIIFVSAKIVINNSDVVQGFFVDLEDVPKEKEPEAEKLQEQQMMEKISSEMFNDLKNQISNENSKLDAGLKDDKGTDASQIYDEAQALQERLNASKNAYEKGLKEAQAILNSRNDVKAGSGDKREDAKIAGNVMVSYSLDGRYSVYLHTPAYQCEGGGKITVSITVNRNGVVIAAAPQKGSSVNVCLNEMAVKAALSSRFNVDGNAADKQQGTITYIFVPQ